MKRHIHQIIKIIFNNVNDYKNEQKLIHYLKLQNVYYDVTSSFNPNEYKNIYEIIVPKQFKRQIHKFMRIRKITHYRDNLLIAYKK
jgi:hypothetical protein